MQLTQHPERSVLHNEVHARPPEALKGHLSIAHIVMVADGAQRAASRAHLATLMRDNHLPAPDETTTHLRVDIGPLRIRWELHTEFVTWTFTIQGPADIHQPSAPPSAVSAVSQDWLAALPGQCLCGLNLWVFPERGSTAARWVKDCLNEQTLVGSNVAGDQAQVYTDFAIHGDGFSRILLFADELQPRRLGRLVQRILEIETYRMAALLGLPAARLAGEALSSAESELAELAQSIRSANRDSEPALLDRLTRLAGQVESQHAASHARLSASNAYFELVEQRIQQISETRLNGLQTIAEFIDRRLTPARKTCEWATRRQDSLSQRVSRMSNLLRTRVEIEQQQSSQALLEALNRRQDLQLKLQATVEGLSVAAITYYIVGLVSYLAKGGQALGWPLSPESTAALAIPLVAVSVWWSIRRMHHRLLSH
ncbi:DUF3422 family protein [Variovorax sp. Sphag1AA]|uniref:DUF3422 family protein n=1 Tax=Variovorax sp. Sphag1AA TaxID=2587027 RepID=UPI001609E526|nr:DUF3422 domain-containing protein [Variovorax sp. Sphag1AA]MBB3180813.1 putative membrane-anchored protein [Variovorax sp. Sphag1AA]